jgi:hypothetical protein
MPGQNTQKRITKEKTATENVTAVSGKEGNKRFETLEELRHTLKENQKVRHSAVKEKSRKKIKAKGISRKKGPQNLKIQVPGRL